MVRWVFLFWIWLSASANAECRLALLLALDVSSAVDAQEDRLQRDGLASALMSSDVRAALLAVPEQSVALAVFEWSGRYQQKLLLDWRLLTSENDILAAAAAIRNTRRSHADFPTALGYAMGRAASFFQDAPVCDRKTIDVSGDGRNNEGFSPRLAYRNFPFDDVTVNGLAIGGADETIAQYYRQESIKGSGAFVEEARDFNDFRDAMQRKLIRETQPLILGWAKVPK